MRAVTRTKLLRSFFSPLCRNGTSGPANGRVENLWSDMGCDALTAQLPKHTGAARAGQKARSERENSGIREGRVARGQETPSLNSVHFSDRLTRWNHCGTYGWSYPRDSWSTG